MKRVFPLVLILVLLAALPACGQKEQSPKVVSYDSISQVSEALGYELLTIEKNSSNLTFSSASVVDDAIGQVEYVSGNSTVVLRMTLDETRFEGLSGYENGGKAGGIDAPSEVFSKLELYVVDETTYFCEFSYTYEEHTCYLSLAETRTDFDTYSILLINYVNQIYNNEDVPDYVYALDPDYGKEEDTDTEAKQAADSGNSSEKEQAEEEKTDNQSSGSGKAEETETTETTEKDQDKATDQAEDSDKAEDTDAEQQTDENSITLEYYDITLVNPGDAYTFSPSGGDGTYTWKSADTSVAEVTASGTVTAVASGETTVTCTSGDASVDIIVRVP